MTVHATINLTRDVTDLDKADDWFAEIKELLDGKTDCVMSAVSSNAEPRIKLEKEE